MVLSPAPSRLGTRGKDRRREKRDQDFPGRYRNRCRGEEGEESRIVQRPGLDVGLWGPRARDSGSDGVGDDQPFTGSRRTLIGVDLL
jgi:hypothetical protein